MANVGKNIRRLRNEKLMTQDELAEQGKTLLVTTHDYEFLMHTCTHICYLLNGRVESFFPVEPKYTPQIYSILFQKEVVL